MVYKAERQLERMSGTRPTKEQEAQKMQHFLHYELLSRLAMQCYLSNGANGRELFQKERHTFCRTLMLQEVKRSPYLNGKIKILCRRNDTSRSVTRGVMLAVVMPAVVVLREILPVQERAPRETARRAATPQAGEGRSQAEEKGAVGKGKAPRQ